jgi:hypothetical protein
MRRLTNGLFKFLCFATSLMIVATSGSYAAKKENNELLTQLDKALKGKVFSSKVVIGSSIQWYCSSNATSPSNLPVDTELYAAGAVGYYARFNLCPHSPVGRIDAGQVTNKLPIGARVTVTGIEVKGDRVELLLSGPGGEYAKIKLMLGKNFAASTDFNGVMRWVDDALRDEQAERIKALDNRFEQLGRELSKNEMTLNTLSNGPQIRLNAATEIQRILRETLQNRSEYWKLTGGLGASQESDYNSRIAGMDNVIQGLEDEAHKVRIGEIRQIMKTEADNEAQMKSSVRGKKAANLEELENQLALLDQCQAIVDHRQSLQVELTTYGDSGLVSGFPDPKAELEEIHSLRDQLERQRSGFQSIQLNNDFKEMENKRIQLLDKYTRATDPSQQRLEAGRLIEHLKRMIENRQQAQKLGNTQAAAQTTRFQKDIERIQRHQ